MTPQDLTKAYVKGNKASEAAYLRQQIKRAENEGKDWKVEKLKEILNESTTTTPEAE